MEHSDLTLERTILSSCINGGEYVYSTICDEINSNDFSLQANKIIFEAIGACINAGEPLEDTFLKKHAKIDEEELFKIKNITAIDDIAFYAKELKEKSIKKQLLALAHLLPSKINENRNVNDIADEFAQKLFEITNSAHAKDIKNVSIVVGELLEEFKRQKENKDKDIIGLNTGFSKLNSMTKGFKGGELIIIAARPSMGKTTLCLNFIDSVLKQDKGVVFFSLEMPALQILQRMLAAKTSLALQKILAGDLNDEEYMQIQDACNEYEKCSFFIYDSGYVTVNDVRAITRKLKNQYKNLGLCVIDYIGLMMSNSNFSDRHLQVAEISRSLKLLARELDIPIIALSQLNRSLESRSNKRPMLSDLRESGAIEQDADTILFVYRDCVYRENDLREKLKATNNKIEVMNKLKKELDQLKINQIQEEAEIIIGKNRNGPIGMIKATFRKENSHFVEAIDNFDNYEGSFTQTEFLSE
ncbi:MULTISPECIES: replicative DNA helicase [unclassified Campylobacter]|uniref:replicative DNA helicase n=1 Tax=unclassified Campylobacter TaxID=2593542 RepID=UPI00123836BD|nr:MULTISPECIES: replicative DNA helicase [unclassified Campylobacter]KAA6226429.1 replicative DNA helicase [Campylobacter sp. LR286c]KAA6226533.1 replicative DNA helicase [Campylobacter sp. LR185c]KAA6226917.1 replicative DNA helicase [Campylobacter sp. LR196d]KAA6233661.1 replicative DNA helicase [Campylobacter sp. LR291e]KAA6233881.1 replicative DNA helicase [Campylobacter sp. LR264d]